jgi:pimeloyl-ACP methyl ester carboxylesterase
MVLLLIFIWIALLVLAWSLQHTLMFPRYLINADRVWPGPPDGVESVWMDTAQGGHVEAQVEAWILPGQGATAESPGPAIIFAHGNAELIDDNLDLHWLTTLGFTVMLVEYRGYGRSTGSPSQKTVVADTTRWVERLADRPEVDGNRIGYMGRSIGTAILAQVATHRPPKSMVMIVPPKRIDAMAWRYGMPGFLIRSPFRSDVALADATWPVLLIARTRDGIIPRSHAPALHELIPDSTLLMLEGTHNNCDTEEESRREQLAITTFFEDTLGQ